MSDQIRINQDIPTKLMLEIQNEMNNSQLIRGKKVFQKYFLVECLEKGLEVIKNENKKASSKKE